MATSHVPMLSPSRVETELSRTLMISSSFSWFPILTPAIRDVATTYSTISILRESCCPVRESTNAAVLESNSEDNWLVRSDESAMPRAARELTGVLERSLDDGGSEITGEGGGVVL